MEKKKEFKYRGKSIEELKTLSVREFAGLLTSRIRRYALRNFQEIESFVADVKSKDSKKKRIKTHKRDMIVVPALVGMKLQIYNGKEFVQVEILNEMLGHRLGEFAPTRPRIAHTKTGVGGTKGTKHKSKK